MPDIQLAVYFHKGHYAVIRTAPLNALKASQMVGVSVLSHTDPVG